MPHDAGRALLAIATGKPFPCIKAENIAGESADQLATPKYTALKIRLAGKSFCECK